MKPLTIALIFLCAVFQMNAQQPTVYEKGPVHEAFLTASTQEGIILQAIAKSPPPEITENIPSQCSAKAVWIPGYWAWEQTIDDFVWVSGVWRIPPPNHVWINGYWKQFDQGWVWIRGFWSTVPEQKLSYIGQRPPTPKNEVIPDSPGNNYQWVSGIWEFNPSKGEYIWLSGTWLELDPNWIYVPGYYLWRPGGYLYIPGYWDYTLEERGCAYAAVIIPPVVRSTIVYTPIYILEPIQIIWWGFPYYPDYFWFFWHHWHFHPGFWNNWCCVPPWWGWANCWCFSWSNNWWLWWWWAHPGFPHPVWLNAQLAMQIPPPNLELLDLMADILPPPILGPWGAVSPWELIDHLDGKPIMPWKPEEIEKIENELKPKEPQEPPLLPEGPEGETKPLPRPPIGDEEEVGENSLTPPPKPDRTPETPEEPPILIPPPPPQDYAPEPPVYAPEPPVYYPPRKPYYPPPGRPYYPPKKPYYPPDNRRPPRYPPQKPDGDGPYYPGRPGKYPPQGDRPGKYPPQGNRPGKYPPQGDRPGKYPPQGNRPEKYPQGKPEGYYPRKPKNPQTEIPQYKSPRGLKWSGRSYQPSEMNRQMYQPRGMRPPGTWQGGQTRTPQKNQFK